MFTFCPYTRNTAKQAYQCPCARTRIVARTRALVLRPSDIFWVEIIVMVNRSFLPVLGTCVSV